MTEQRIVQHTRELLINRHTNIRETGKKLNEEENVGSKKKLIKHYHL